MTPAPFTPTIGGHARHSRAGDHPSPPADSAARTRRSLSPATQHHDPRPRPRRGACGIGQSSTRRLLRLKEKAPAGTGLNAVPGPDNRAPSCHPRYATDRPTAAQATARRLTTDTASWPAKTPGLGRSGGQHRPGYGAPHLGTQDGVRAAASTSPPLAPSDGREDGEPGQGRDRPGGDQRRQHATMADAARMRTAAPGPRSRSRGCRQGGRGSTGQAGHRSARRQPDQRGDGDRDEQHRHDDGSRDRAVPVVLLVHVGPSCG